MCGRYTLTVDGADLVEHFGLDGTLDYVPHYNIAPTQSVPVIRKMDAGVRPIPAMLRWGLIPSWAKDAGSGSRMINARSETAAEKPSFRTLLKSRRCLVPSTGFFEWRQQEEAGVKRKKQPYYIHRLDKQLFAFAGLWDHWRGGSDEQIDSFTILTTRPNDLIRPLHDRMPVIVRRVDYDLWLDPATHDVERLNPLLCPHPAEGWVAHPVGTHVNSPAHDEPRCIEYLT